MEKNEPNITDKDRGPEDSIIIIKDDIIEHEQLRQSELIQILQAYLFEISEENLYPTIQYIIDSVFCTSVERIEQLARNIFFAARFRCMKIELLSDLVCALILKASSERPLEKLPGILMNHFFTKAFHDEYSYKETWRFFFLYQLLKRKIYLEDDIINEIRKFYTKYTINKNEDHIGLFKIMCAWFAPEIEQKAPDLFAFFSYPQDSFLEEDQNDKQNGILFYTVKNKNNENITDNQNQQRSLKTEEESSDDNDDGNKEEFSNAIERSSNKEKQNGDINTNLNNFFYPINDSKNKNGSNRIDDINDGENKFNDEDNPNDNSKSLLNNIKFNSTNNIDENSNFAGDRSTVNITSNEEYILQEQEEEEEEEENMNNHDYQLDEAFDIESEYDSDPSFYIFQGNGENETRVFDVLHNQGYSLDFLRANDWNFYRHCRELGYTVDPLVECLLADDDDNLQKLSTDPNFDLETMIEPSLFSRSTILQDSTSPICFAAAVGAVKCFRFLLLNNANLDYETWNEYSTTIASFGVSGGSNEIVRLLNQKGVSFNEALFVSVQYHRTDIFNWLFQLLNTDIEITSTRYGTLLHRAAKSNNVELSLFCMEHRCDVNKPVANRFFIKKILYDFFADDKTPPLSEAIQFQAIDVAKLLLSHKDSTLVPQIEKQDSLVFELIYAHNHEIMPLFIGHKTFETALLRVLLLL